MCLGSWAMSWQSASATPCPTETYGELIRVIYGLFRTPFVVNSRSRNHSRKVTQNCYHHPPDSTRIRY